MSLIIYILIAVTILMNTAAQIALKTGMIQIGTFSFTCGDLLPAAIKIASSPWIIGGITIYVFSVCTWLMVLSRAPVSIAYPLSSLGYVTSAIAAYYICGEDLTVTRILGIIVILLGVYLVAKS